VQAEAGLRAANASGAEVESVRDYAVVRAPFAGIVTRRFVDPGAFAAPGMPLATIQDASRLLPGRLDSSHGRSRRDIQCATRGA